MLFRRLLRGAFDGETTLMGFEVMIRDVWGERRVAFVLLGSASRVTAAGRGLFDVPGVLPFNIAPSAMRLTAGGVGVAGSGLSGALICFFFGVEGPLSDSAPGPTSSARVFRFRKFFRGTDSSSAWGRVKDSMLPALTKRADLRKDIATVI